MRIVPSIQAGADRGVSLLGLEQPVEITWEVLQAARDALHRRVEGHHPGGDAVVQTREPASQIERLVDGFDGRRTHPRSSRRPTTTEMTCCVGPLTTAVTSPSALVTA